jgi:hypothetical protein
MDYSSRLISTDPVPLRQRLVSVRAGIDYCFEVFSSNTRNEFGEAKGLVVYEVSKYLSSIRGSMFPVFVCRSRILLQPSKVDTRAVCVGKDEDEEAVEVLSFGCPLALNDTRASPGRGSNVMSIELLIWRELEIDEIGPAGREWSGFLT